MINRPFTSTDERGTVHCKSIQDILDRLASYEELGYLPYELKDLIDTIKGSGYSIDQIRDLLRPLQKIEVLETTTNSRVTGMDGYMIGQKVIVRTYTAGVHFGTLNAKAGKEVILGNARRLWKWYAADGVCTHGVARYGIIGADSIICAPVTSLWLEAIEIIPCTEVAAYSIEEAEYAHHTKRD